MIGEDTVLHDHLCYPATNSSLKEIIKKKHKKYKLHIKGLCMALVKFLKRAIFYKIVSKLTTYFHGSGL